MRDHATLPDNGIIYDGDYYRGIPFHEYIKDQSLDEEVKRTGATVFDIRDYGAVDWNLCIDGSEDVRVKEIQKRKHYSKVHEYKGLHQ